MQKISIGQLYLFFAESVANLAESVESKTLGASLMVGVGVGVIVDSFFDKLFSTDASKSSSVTR